MTQVEFLDHQIGLLKAILQATVTAIQSATERRNTLKRSAAQIDHAVSMLTQPDPPAYCVDTAEIARLEDGDG